MDSTASTQTGKRLARNTLLLYGRMLLLLFVGLYTSRVVLDALGIDDSGVYNAVGGVVASFAVISGALSSAISRFLTFELGKRDGLSQESSAAPGKLAEVFAASVMIQIVIAALIVVVAEPLGIWFIDHKLTIPADRLTAAHWVFQFSLATFVINLISVPYNAALIAHERMKAFAYIGIFEGLAKLGVALLLTLIPADRLIAYAGLMCLVALCVRATYSIYCRRSFTECAARPRFDWGLMKQMFSFAGWNFVGASSAVLRDQGGNILINIYCGLSANTARMLAMQLGGAVQGFVTNFMTATNPQITKSYASGEREYLMKLIFKGARLSFLMLLILSVPVIFNIDFVLDLWLKEIPDKTASLVLLTLVFAMSESLSGPLVTAQLATGKIRDYQLIVGGIQLLNIPLALVLLRAGHGPEAVLYAAIALSQLALFARLILLRRMIGLDAGGYLLRVYLRSALVAALVVGASLLIKPLMGNGWWWFVLSCFCYVLATSLVIWLVGLEGDEKRLVLNKLLHRK